MNRFQNLFMKPFEAGSDYRQKSDEEVRPFFNLPFFRVLAGSPVETISDQAGTSLT
jgi:hypothetical protein